MLTIRAAATLLQASSSANGLIDLSRAVGGTVGPPAPLDADACTMPSASVPRRCTPSYSPDTGPFASSR